MAKPTLLELVQDVMSALSMDEINSIEDTSEALQVATVFKTVYNDITTNKDWEHLKRPVKLLPSGTTDRPTHMSLEEDINKLVEGSVHYNKVRVSETRARWSPIKFLQNDEFLRMIDKRNTDETNVVSIFDPSGVQLLILNDKQPEYFTTFDDEVWVFDSYDSVIDSTLQASKTRSVAYFSSTLTVSDTTVPDLPKKVFSLLYNQALSNCSLLFNNTLNSKAEQEANKQNRWLSQQSKRTSKLKILGKIKYGRR